MHVFGLTGGFATGKTTVVRRFRARGVPVLEADDLAREVVTPGSEGLAAVVDAFGREMLDAAGALDRKKLARLVFCDAAARSRLEAVLHPLIRELQKRRLRVLEERGEPLACYEAPLLVEVGLASELRPLVVVVTDEKTQFERARGRDGLDDASIRARLGAQLPLAKKVELADYVIDNSKTLDDTWKQADDVLDAICRASGIAPERYPRPAPG